MVLAGCGATTAAEPVQDERRVVAERETCDDLDHMWSAIESGQISDDALLSRRLGEIEAVASDRMLRETSRLRDEIDDYANGRPHDVEGRVVRIQDMCDDIQDVGSYSYCTRERGYSTGTDEYRKCREQAE
jgi:hypothetical protein